MGVRGYVVGACCAALTSSVASAGPDWIERNDAGSSIGTAQVPTRSSTNLTLSSLSGSLSSSLDQPDYEDLYFIRIANPGTFSIRPAFAEFDPVLYLFNITVNGEGYGLLGNDDESPTSNLPKLMGASTDGTMVIVTFPGDYVLAVTTQGRHPFSRSGDIFNLASPTEISGPDGPGGINPLEGWRGSGQTGRYGFTLEATEFPRTPAPGVALTLIAGVVGLTGRRRRA